MDQPVSMKGGTQKNTRVLQKGEAKKTILISEIFQDIPPDEKLRELIPNPNYPKRSLVTQQGLEVLKLRLEGLNVAETAEKLHMTHGQVNHWAQSTVRRLSRYLPDNIELDIPVLRKVLDKKPFHFTGSYTKLSELLRDMPSDEVLFQLDRERGNFISGRKRHRVTNQDLHVLRQRLAGCTYQSIGEAFGKNSELTRRWIRKIKFGLEHYLCVELDEPGLFDQVEEI